MSGKDLSKSCQRPLRAPRPIPTGQAPPPPHTSSTLPLSETHPTLGFSNFGRAAELATGPLLPYTSQGMRPRYLEHSKREVWEAEPLGGWVWLILGTERNILLCALGSATCPCHPSTTAPHAPAPAECSRNEWKTFIGYSQNGFHQNRTLSLPSSPRRKRTLTLIITKIRASAPRAFQATSPALPGGSQGRRPPSPGSHRLLK